MKLKAVLPDIKPAFDVLCRLLLVCVQLLQHYVDILTNTPSVLAFVAWLGRLQERPWLRKCRNAVFHIAAFIIGSTYEDERVAFSAARLVTNDAYRDRLLVPEIADLVALSDALQLSVPQRKAYFQCFLHVDCMRRATVSRAELLRYCNLRATSLTTFLLPDARMPTHRAVGRHRWDVLQLLAACFSVCTADLEQLVQLVVAEACRPEEEDTDDDVPKSELNESPEDRAEELHTAPSQTAATVDICRQIDRCLRFGVGIPDASELSLQRLLNVLYDDVTEKNELEQAAEPSLHRLNFQEIHGVSSLSDVARLFPVLVFPCIWVHRVLRLRILGARTWHCLQRRRHELQPHVPASSLFLSVSDIIAASQTHTYQKNGADKELPVVKGIAEPTDSARSDGNGHSRASAPRKIVPCDVNASEQVTTSEKKTEVSSASSLRPTNNTAGFEQFSTLKDAWRTTANHALASIHVQCVHSSSSSLPNEDGLKMEFQWIAKHIAGGQLEAEQCERIRQRLVRDYGYQFAHFLLEKSSVKEQSPASRTPAQERRAQQRYARAWNGDALVEDKGIYWKELRDPVAKREFYYNARTGESRWEKPVTFVSRTVKKKKRRKRRQTPPQQQSESALKALVGGTGEAPVSM